jgi:hypothetical protein
MPPRHSASLHAAQATCLPLQGASTPEERLARCHAEDMQPLYAEIAPTLSYWQTQGGINHSLQMNVSDA